VVVPAKRRNAWERRYTLTKADISSMLNGLYDLMSGHLKRMCNLWKNEFAEARSCSLVGARKYDCDSASFSPGFGSSLDGGVFLEFGGFDSSDGRRDEPSFVDTRRVLVVRKL